MERTRSSTAMFPLSTVLFPHADLALYVFEPRYRRLMADCLAGSREFGVVLIDRGNEVGGGDHRVDVGTWARVRSVSEQPDGSLVLIVHGTRRLRVVEWLGEDPYPVAAVEDLDGPAATTGAPGATGAGGVPGAEEVRRGGVARLADRAEVALRRAIALLSELGEAPAVPLGLDLGPDPDERAWRLCALAPLGLYDRQRLLQADAVEARLELVLTLVTERAEDAQRLLAGGLSSGD